MFNMAKKLAITTGLLGLVPLIPWLSAGGSEAFAHTYTHGSVTIGTPIGVVGFSYGDPYVVGHVHPSPVYCDAGPLYFYPQYGVYGHYHPGYRYVRYARPAYYHHAYGHHHHGYVSRGHRAHHHGHVHKSEHASHRKRDRIRGH